MEFNILTSKRELFKTMKIIAFPSRSASQTQGNSNGNDQQSQDGYRDQNDRDWNDPLINRRVLSDGIFGSLILVIHIFSSWA
jgi:hypothetical protein